MKQDVYTLICQLEHLLLIEGYHKNELANLVHTTVMELDKLMHSPEKTDISQNWCQEINFLYEMNHKFNQKYFDNF